MSKGSSPTAAAVDDQVSLPCPCMSEGSVGSSIKRHPVSKTRDPILSNGNSPSSPITRDPMSENSPIAGTSAGHLALVVAGRKGKAGDSSVGVAGEQRTISGGGPRSLCSAIQEEHSIVWEAVAKGEQRSGVRPLELVAHSSLSSGKTGGGFYLCRLGT